ncbi:MAG: formyltetrahydrofolate deformylase [Verrucomicrobiota bacterium]
MSATAILLFTATDQQGIVAEVSNFIFRNRGNIVELDQHVEKAEEVFFMRLEWELEGFLIQRDALESALRDLIRPFGVLSFHLYFRDVKPRLALTVSKESHCLYDLLARYESGELMVEIPLIISNHEALRKGAEKFGIPFHVFPISKENKQEQEQAEIALIQEHDVDTVVLARYMQILSGDFVKAFPMQVINIHHSFLPAFIGAKPYHQAHARGVKLVGATSHYVTEDLDQGPIIAQDVIRVSHQDTAKDLVRKGKDLEKVVLSRAVWHHSSRNVLTHKNKTVVFE